MTPFQRIYNKMVTERELWTCCCSGKPNYLSIVKSVKRCLNFVYAHIMMLLNMFFKRQNKVYLTKQQKQ